MATAAPVQRCMICGNYFEWEAVPSPLRKNRLVFGPTEWRQKSHKCPPGAVEKWAKNVVEDFKSGAIDVGKLKAKTNAVTEQTMRVQRAGATRYGRPMRKQTVGDGQIRDDVQDWKPRFYRQSGIYCSPACGCKCTRSDFDDATRKASELATRMGERWTPIVWENFGWHYKIEKGVFEICPSSDGYSAWFQGSKQFIAHAVEPEDALGFLVQSVRTFMTRLEHELTA